MYICSGCQNTTVATKKYINVIGRRWRALSGAEKAAWTRAGLVARNENEAEETNGNGEQANGNGEQANGEQANEVEETNGNGEQANGEANNANKTPGQTKR